MRALLYILFSVLFNVAGQMVLKGAMIRLGTFNISLSADFLRNSIRVIFYPLTLLGLLLYAISALFWLAALSQMELSKAYPMISLGYIIVFFLSAWIFGESLSFLRFVGILFVALGLFLVAMS